MGEQRRFCVMEQGTLIARRNVIAPRERDFFRLHGETSLRLRNMDDVESKACPRCRQWTQRDGGCNIMSCPCGKKWCFVCGRGEEHGCRHFMCAFVDSAAPRS